MENNPVGRFVLIVQGHAVAVVNGVLYGNTNENAIGLYRSVWMGFEIKIIMNNIDIKNIFENSSLST